MNNIFWEVYQEEKARNTRSMAQNAILETEKSGDNIDRLYLITHAMWIIMKEKFGLTDDELIAQVNALDLQDGIINGKGEVYKVTCPNCQMTISTKFRKCLYCGRDCSDISVFVKSAQR